MGQLSDARRISPLRRRRLHPAGLRARRQIFRSSGQVGDEPVGRGAGAVQRSEDVDGRLGQEDEGGPSGGILLGGLGKPGHDSIQGKKSRGHAFHSLPDQAALVELSADRELQRMEQCDGFVDGAAGAGYFR